MTIPAAAEPSLGLGVNSAMNELRLSQDSLRELADETGGVAASTLRAAGATHAFPDLAAGGVLDALVGG